MSQTLTDWLQTNGLAYAPSVIHNPSRARLIMQAVCHQEGVLTHTGALRVITAPYTGRSPKDKFIVKRPAEDHLWWGDVNQPLSPEVFAALRERIAAYLRTRALYVIDCAIGADPRRQYSIRLVTEFAWQALAAQNMFIYDGRPHVETPDITLLAAPDYHVPDDLTGFNSEAAICLDLKQKAILIAGSKYAGEIKKSVFSMMNALLPPAGVLPMHCAANVGERGDVALFFGLSGTGKTTLSATPERRLVGDDEHGWGDEGIFNFEGGCYAKTIRLSQESEPVIWQAANQFGTVLENVILKDDTSQPDFDDNSITENTRASYDLSQVENIMPGGTATHPTHIFFLSADAFGVLPPVARLTPDEAVYYFLSGYTSKVAGTERGVGKMPEATFSTCFAEPFLPLKPKVYAGLLREKVRAHGCQVWLIDTGWTGGSYQTGYRVPLKYTRRMVNWILSGDWQQAQYHVDPVFGLRVPDAISGIPQDLLYPEQGWQDHADFVAAANRLKGLFEENFANLGADYVDSVETA